MGLMAWWRRQEGMVTVLVALALAAIVGLGAISLDVGRMYLARGRLQDVADSAALAGAALLPEEPSQAVAEATDYALLNGVPEGLTGAQVEGDVIRVTVRQHVDSGFGRALGVPGTDLNAECVARVGALSRLRGAAPFGVEAMEFVYGEVYTLKEGGGGGCQGNFGALALGGSGAANYRENLRHGYQSWLALGDSLETEPGNMSGPTCQGLQERLDADPEATYLDVDPDSPRLLAVPVVEGLDVEGRGEVAVVGFAAFFLEGVSDGEVVGRFLRLVVDGPSEGFPEAPDCGFRVVKLI